MAKAKRGGTEPVKLLLYGPPGVGKSTIADMLALEFTRSPWSIEEVPGKVVTVETVKDWMRVVRPPPAAADTVFQSG